MQAEASQPEPAAATPSRRRPGSWLPAVIALPVTGLAGLLATGNVASGALDDSGPYPHMGWYYADVVAQAGLGLAAIALLVAGLTRGGSRRGVAVWGWIVLALSVAVGVGTTVLGAPSLRAITP